MTPVAQGPRFARSHAAPRNLYHWLMKTTLDIDDRLLAQAKSEAAAQRLTLTHLIEQGIAIRLRAKAPTPTRRRKAKLPTYDGGQGLNPGIDPLSNRSLYDAAD